MYALSYYAFYRTLWHISLLHYWHLPLMLAVVLRSFSARRPPLAGWPLAGALGVAALAGMLEFYYAAIIGQFFGLAALFHLWRRAGWRRVLVPIALGGALVAGFLVTQLDTLRYPPRARAQSRGGRAKRGGREHARPPPGAVAAAVSARVDRAANLVAPSLLGHPPRGEEH